MTTDLVQVVHGRAEIDWLELLRGDTKEWTEVEVFLAASLLDAVSKATEERFGHVKELARAIAPPGFGGAVTVDKDDVSIQFTAKKPSVKVNEPSLMALLTKKGLDPEQICFRKVTVDVLDAARLEQAIAGGVFTDQEVQLFTETGKQQVRSVTIKRYGMGITAKRLLGEE